MLAFFSTYALDATPIILAILGLLGFALRRGRTDREAL